MLTLLVDGIYISGFATCNRKFPTLKLLVTFETACSLLDSYWGLVQSLCQTWYAMRIFISEDLRLATNSSSKTHDWLGRMIDVRNEDRR